MIKNLYSFLSVLILVLTFSILSSNTALATPIVKGYLIVPENWKERIESDIPRYKQNILSGLKDSQEFYSLKLGGNTFSYDPNIEVLYAEGSISDSYFKGNENSCPYSLFFDHVLKLPQNNIIVSPKGETHALFFAGTGSAINDCAIFKYQTAFYTQQSLEGLGSSDPDIKRGTLLGISHELGHIFGLTYSDYAMGHPCSVLSKDQCQRDVGTASKPYPPREECLNSIMGGRYCRDEDGKVIPLNFNKIGFDNSIWNPEVKSLLKTLGVSSSNPIPKPTPFIVNPTPLLTETPIPTLIPITEPQTPSPFPSQNPTPVPAGAIAKIIISNYGDFGLNQPGDSGSLTQTFDTQSQNPIIWKKSTLSPKSPIYVAPVNPDGTSGEISAVYLSDGQIYKVSNSSFVVQAKVEKKIASVKINNEDIVFPFTIPVRIHLPGEERIAGRYSIPIVITYNDDSSKSLLFTFNYMPVSMSVSPSPSTSSSPTIFSSPSPSLSNDEALCQARGGACQVSCTGEFSTQVGACSDTTVCCSRTLEVSQTGSKCPGDSPMNFGWGGSCRLGETDVALPANGGTACSIASCYFNQGINEYCWYNSGEAYQDYEGCKAKRVLIDANLYGKEK